MARGRMINRKISLDRGVERLIESPDVGAWGGLFYTWLITHLDKEGRAPGDPRVLKGMVCPRLDSVTIEIIESTLAAASGIGLIEMYEAGGDRFLWFPKFSNNQVGLRREREPASDYPAPPTSAGSLPEESHPSGGNDPAEGKGREGNLNKGKGAARTSRSDLKTVDLSGDRTAIIRSVKEIFDYWASKGHKEDFPQPHSSLKVWREVEKRLQSDGFTVEQVKTAIDGIHNDDWEGRADNMTLWHVVKDETAVQRMIAKAKKKAPTRSSNPAFRPHPSLSKPE